LFRLASVRVHRVAGIIRLSIMPTSPFSARTGLLATNVHFFYADSMAGQDFLRLEELIRRHNIVDSPIAAMDLEAGMVLRSGGRLRVVISVSYENTESGPMAVVESVNGLERFASDSILDAWHINGEPFIIELPPEEIGTCEPPAGGGGSSPPAHDAAGIVPVWRGPKRFD
jgi:hypothetical protein